MTTITQIPYRTAELELASFLKSRGNRTRELLARTLERLAFTSPRTLLVVVTLAWTTTICGFLWRAPN
jgi:hypothetical protein